MVGGLVALSAVHNYDYFTRKLIEEYSTNLAAVYQAACSRRLLECNRLLLSSLISGGEGRWARSMLSLSHFDE
jgi:hypothetical protein